MAHTRNVQVALEEHPDLRGAVRLNEFTRKIEVTRCIPKLFDGGPFPRPLQNTDITALVCWCEENITGINASKVSDAITLVARRNAFDPLRDWISALPAPEDATILDDWLVKYLGCPDTPWVRTVGKKWLIGAAARALTPGEKVDTALILEGRQGVGKSTAVAALCPDETWFTDNPGPLGTRESAELIQGKWIVEVGELVGFSRSQIEDVKRFLSATVDTYRAPYDRLPDSHPRRSVFVGTTNEAEYLKDHTGNRRFWPVKVGRVDLAGLKKARDQLWAAARDAVAPMAWVLTAEERELANTETADRLEIDPWQEFIEQKWGNNSAGRKTTWLTIASVFSELQLDGTKQTKRERGRVSRILTQLGGEYGRKLTNGVKVRGFNFPSGIRTFEEIEGEGGPDGPHVKKDVVQDVVHEKVSETMDLFAENPNGPLGPLEFGKSQLQNIHGIPNAAKISKQQKDVVHPVHPPDWADDPLDF